MEWKSFSVTTMTNTTNTETEMMTMLTTSEKIKVRACSIICNAHPEWGTWGVMEDCGDWFVIHGRSGSRVLFKDEADKFWSVTN